MTQRARLAVGPADSAISQRAALGPPTATQRCRCHRIFRLAASVAAARPRWRRIRPGQLGILARSACCARPGHRAAAARTAGQTSPGQHQKRQLARAAGGKRRRGQRIMGRLPEQHGQDFRRTPAGADAAVCRKLRSCSAACRQAERSTSRWVTSRMRRGPNADTSTPRAASADTSVAASGEPGRRSKGRCWSPPAAPPALRAARSGPLPEVERARDPRRVAPGDAAARSSQRPPESRPAACCRHACAGSAAPDRYRPSPAEQRAGRCAEPLERQTDTVSNGLDRSAGEQPSAVAAFHRRAPSRCRRIPSSRRQRRRLPSEPSARPGPAAVVECSLGTAESSEPRRDRCAMADE